MAAYLQLGHESWNLLDERALGSYKGIVLSPVNDAPAYVLDRLFRLGERRESLEVLLDPQLYNPASEKGQLGSWAYFPADFETANQGDVEWWQSRAADIVLNAKSVGADAACSPAFLPRHFSNDYYELIVNVADSMKAKGGEAGVEVLLTAIVGMRELFDPTRANAIASILSASDCDRLYLFFLDDAGPREQYKDSEALPTAVHLVRLLSETMRVQVAFCGHDLVLWKFAGAQDVTSGKWLNVRRFSPGRWSDDESQGRQVAYWNEGHLLTLLRDADVLLLDRAKWYEGRSFAANPFSEQILQILRSRSGQPWQALSWKQYLRWVANTEANLATPALVSEYLARVDERWNDVARKRLLFVDRFNDGSWARVWSNACQEGAAR